MRQSHDVDRRSKRIGRLTEQSGGRTVGIFDIEWAEGMAPITDDTDVLTALREVLIERKYDCVARKRWSSPRKHKR